MTGVPAAGPALPLTGTGASPARAKGNTDKRRKADSGTVKQPEMQGKRLFLAAGSPNVFAGLAKRNRMPPFFFLRDKLTSIIFQVTERLKRPALLRRNNFCSMREKKESVSLAS